MTQPGDVVAGRYKILRPLGEGAFGLSFVAEDKLVQTQCVLKIAHSIDEDVPQRFAREAAVLSRIQHPSIVAIFDSGTASDGRAYLVMEYVDGETIADRLARDGAFPIGRATAITLQVANGLQALHREGAIHRDVKPTNVMVTADGRAKLIDFGAFGRLVGNTGMTQSGQLVGTPYYMSPEQVRGQSQGPQADVYGLGLLLFEMVFGRRPFEADSPTELFGKILMEGIVVPGDAPGPLRDFLLRALDRDPSQRHSGGAEAAAELEAVIRTLDDEGWSRRTIGERTAEADRDDGLASTVTADLNPVPAPAPPASDGDLVSTATGRLMTSSTRAEPSRVGPRSASWTKPLLVVSLGLAAAIGAYLVSGDPLRLGIGPVLLWSAIGVSAVAMGFLLAHWIRARAAEAAGESGRQAGAVLLNLRSREDLGRTLAVEVSAVIARAQEAGDRALGLTVLGMIREYETSRNAKNSQDALMNAAELLEKLTSRLAPWYVRHEKSLAFCAQAAGVASGALSVLAGLKGLIGD